MSKKAKEIILIAVAGVVRLGVNIAVVDFICKYWIEITVVITMLFYLLCYISFYFLFYFITMPFLSVPETSYAEFPFEIVYSVDGEVFENRGVVISTCSPDFELERGAYCSVDEEFKESFDDDILLTKDDYDVRIDCGNASYYLLDSKLDEDYAPGQYIYYVFKGQEHTFTLEEAKEEFGIEIISTKFSEPIKNNDYENVIIHYLRELFKGK